MDNRKFLGLRFHLVLGLCTVIVLVGGLGLWSATAQISGAIVAAGHVEVDQDRQVVQHLDGGIVDRVLVADGDRMEAGEALIVLDDSELASELVVVETQLFELMARVGRLTAERDGTSHISFEEELVAEATMRPDVEELISGQIRLFEARRNSLEKEATQLGRRREQIGSQIEGIEAQTAALVEQVALIELELNDQQQLLDKGLAQASRVLSLQRQKSELLGSIGQLTASRAEALGRITEIDIEIDKLDTNRREEAITQLRDLRGQLFRLQEQKRSLDVRLDRLEVVAPASGVVYGMTVNTPNSIVRSAEPLAYIIPQDRPLIISARIEPIHIDEVHVGQPVRLRFTALTKRETPESNGRVLRISADAYSDEHSGQTYYRAEIAPDRDTMEALKDGEKILPGMPVEAYIQTGQRSPISYLFKPFTDYFNRAFRES